MNPHLSRVRGVTQETAVRPALDEDIHGVLIRETRRCVRKPDRAIRCDVERLEKLHRRAVDAAGEHLDIRVRRDAEQAPLGVGDDQPVLAVDPHAERIAAGIGELLVFAGRIEAHDAPVLVTRVHPAVGRCRDVLGSDADALQ